MLGKPLVILLHLAKEMIPMLFILEREEMILLVGFQLWIAKPLTEQVVPMELMFAI